MSKREGQLHLNLVVRGSGHHAGAWRHPQSKPNRDLSLAYYIKLAKLAEKGLFDALFMADTYNLGGPARRLEPFTLMSALAAVTEKIGLIATAETCFNEPYHIARKFSSLDHISGGRSGWNVVTGAYSVGSLFNGKDYPNPAERYKRAEEFVQVTKQLWDSWEHVEPEEDSVEPFSRVGIHEVNFKGDYYNIKGTLNVQRPVQGYPVIVQAGASEEGRELGAEIGEIIFSAQQTLEAAKAFYKDIKSRMPKYNRSLDSLLLIPGLSVIVADTEQEAKEIEWEFTSYVNRMHILEDLSRWFSVNLNEYSLDDPVPLDKIIPPSQLTSGITSRGAVYIDSARREKMTIRELFNRCANGHGHMTIAGTAVQVADLMEQWFIEYGADGFNLMPHSLPGGLESIVNKLIPELQNRKLFRTAYSGNTLREHLGLTKPNNTLISHV